MNKEVYLAWLNKIVFELIFNSDLKKLVNYLFDIHVDLNKIFLFKLETYRDYIKVYIFC